MQQDKVISMAKGFLSLVDSELVKNKIRLDPHWSIDHICYRVTSLDRYLEMKSSLALFSTLLGESQVNSRPICTFKLNHGITFADRYIDLIELPAPKELSQYEEGFEHIEVVCDLPFDELKSKYSSLEFKSSGLTKPFNAELAIPLKGCAIKFHHLSLESVVTLESNEPVFTVLQKSKVLTLLKDYNPQVVGTFPLGISVATSDLDIIVNAQDLKDLYDEIIKHFSCENNFIIKKDTSGGHDYVLGQFSIDGILFEIFAQQIETFKQRGYRHFQIEERLLKLGGLKFKNQIQLLKESGFKTEPAFSKALNLVGDPYEELLKLYKLSDQTLKTKFKSELLN